MLRPDPPQRRKDHKENLQGGKGARGQRVSSPLCCRFAAPAALRGDFVSGVQIPMLEIRYSGRFFSKRRPFYIHFSIDKRDHFVYLYYRDTENTENAF